MANLIKNALIKQLSKFLKNVSANQINISTFKGEGEMKNIQLDENVLMDLIELPTWLKITNARCNKATFKVQWTKLKTTPIIICLDRIELEMETTERLREPSKTDSKLFDKDANGPYTFIDKCIDAIQLNIDSVSITIKSEKFNANLSMSNIYVYSCTPQWKVTNNIQNTRLKDLEKEEIILFKEISWEICRLEAFMNLEPGVDSNQQQTSIKLIMNPSKIQIALKKKLTDKSSICSTLRILLNEIYWMANDVQLKAAIGTYNSISKLMKKASLQQRKHVAEMVHKPTKPTQIQQRQSDSPDVKKETDDSKVFCQYDIKETSLHLHISVLNIHLYADDNYSGNTLIEGGAMQVLFKNLWIDHYPYHKTGWTTKHWNNYNQIFTLRETWSKSLVKDFIKKLQTILGKANISDLSKAKLKLGRTLLEACTIVTLQDLSVYKVTTNVASASQKPSKRFTSKSDTEQSPQIEKSPSFNELLTTRRFFIDQQTYDKRPFFSSNYAEYNLPSDTLFMHFFFSDFYFPEDCNYPVPCSQVYAYLSPMLINLDYLTLLWVNTLLLSLYHEKLIVDENLRVEDNSRKKVTCNSKSDAARTSNIQTRLNLHVDTYLEFLMPKLVLSIFPSKLEDNFGMSTLSRIEVGLSRVCLTNTSLDSGGSERRADLNDVCSKASKSVKNLCIKQNNFREDYNQKIKIETSQHFSSKLKSLAPCFNDILRNQNLSYLRHDLSSSNNLTKLINTVNEANIPKLGLFLRSLNRNALNKTALKDIWCVDLNGFWLDCCSTKSNCADSKNTLIKDTSFMIWLVNVHDFYKSCDTRLPTSLLDQKYPTRQSKHSLSNESIQVQNLEHIYERLSNVIQIEPVKVPEMLSPPVQIKSRRSNSLSTSTMIQNRGKSSQSMCQQAYSRINVIGKIDTLKVRCNHEQLLFILRFLETFGAFNEQMAVDSEQTLKYNKSSNQKIERNISETDKNNNMRKSQKNGLNLNIEDFSSDESESWDVSPAANVSLLINSVEIELEINNYDEKHAKKLILDNKEITGDELQKTESRNSDLEVGLSGVDNLIFETTNFNIQINDPMKQNKSDAISPDLDDGLIDNYLKYLYGINIENPNLKLSYGTSIDDNLSQYQQRNVGSIGLNKGLDLLGIEIPDSVRKASLSSITSNNMGVHFSAVSSSVTSSTQLFTNKTQLISNKTASFFNKPLSNINSVIKTVKTQAEALESEFLDDSISFSSNLMSMDQDNTDTASLISFTTDYSNSTSILPTNNTLEKQNSSGSLKSFNSLSSLNRTNVQQQQFTQSSSSLFLAPISDVLIDSQEPVLMQEMKTAVSTTLSDSQTQTFQQTKKIKIVLGNLQMYAQMENNSDLSAYVKLDQISLDDKVSKPMLENLSSSENSVTTLNHEVLVQFRKKKNDPVLKDGMVDLIIENILLEVDVPSLNGIIDFIDDDGDESEKIKPSLPANIQIRNTKFILNKSVSNKLEKFKNKILIENLYVKKSRLNEIVLNVYQGVNRGRSSFKRSKVPRIKSFDKEMLIVDYEAKVAEKEMIDKVSGCKAEQLASLVFLLRKSKEENHRLQTRLENEVLKAAMIEKEKQDSQKKEVSFEQFELERKQFESLLQSYEEENQVLKAKLKKSEDMNAILNIERGCIINKLNEQLKANKR